MIDVSVSVTQASKAATEWLRRHLNGPAPFCESFATFTATMLHSLRVAQT